LDAVAKHAFSCNGYFENFSPNFFSPSCEGDAGRVSPGDYYNYFAFFPHATGLPMRAAHDGQRRTNEKFLEKSEESFCFWEKCIVYLTYRFLLPRYRTVAEPDTLGTGPGEIRYVQPRIHLAT